MKRIMLALVIALLVIPGAALASDTTDAEYRGTVTVSNNSTAASGVATVFTANTTSFINQGFINASCNNTSIVSAAGSDLAYMPGYNGPWCVWVPSIAAYSYFNDVLYTGGGNMDGDTKYFPGSTGMVITDAASMEPSDNFTISFDDTYFDSTTTASVLEKADAITITTGSGNITATIISDTPNWRVPTAVADAGGTWTNEANAIDNNTGTFGYTSGNVANGAWSDNLTFEYSSSIPLSKVRYWYQSITSDTGTLVDIDYYADGAWHDGWQGAGGGAGGWREQTVLADSTSKISWRVYNGSGGAQQFRIYEVSLGETANIEATHAVTTGEHDLEVSANTTHLNITSDSVLLASTALGGASVPDNAYNWYAGSLTATIYIGQFGIEIDGIPVCTLAWEYDTTFTDTSGNGNDGTPTFRTTSSDADVSAELVTFAPVYEADAPAYTLTDPPDFITTTPGMSGNFTSTINATYPGHNVITAIAVGGAVPEQLPTILIFTFILVIISITVSAVFRSHGTGPIFLKSLIVAMIMAVYVAVGIYNAWQVYFFAIIALGAAWLSRQREAY